MTASGGTAEGRTWLNAATARFRSRIAIINRSLSGPRLDPPDAAAPAVSGRGGPWLEIPGQPLAVGVGEGLADQSKPTTEPDQQVADDAHGHDADADADAPFQNLEPPAHPL